MQYGLLNNLRCSGRRSLSGLVGYLTTLKVPQDVLARVIHSYANRFLIDLEESALSPEEAESFVQFFTRPLKPGLRPLDEAEQFLLSPADGLFTVGGPIKDGRLEQVKGRTYALGDFLNDSEAERVFDGGDHMVVYLSPSDYHRVHFPVTGKVTGWRYIPGDKLTVQPHVLLRTPDVFVRNERLVVFQDTEFGKMATVLVGATCVAKLTMSFDKDLEEQRFHYENFRNYKDPIEVSAGDELGMFEMGSTVVVLCEPGMVDVLQEKTDSKIRYGKSLAKWRK